MPVERLDREKRAGGRRRANREEGSRGRHGPRPEEVRAERRQQAEPSRRQREAQSRENASERSTRQGSASSSGSGQASRGATPQNTSFAESFRAGVEGPKPVAPAELGGTTAGPANAPASEPGSPSFLPTDPQPGAPAQTPAADRVAQGSAPRAAAVTAVGSARVGQAQPGVTATPDGAPGKNTISEGTERSEASRPEATARWAETAEAERAAAVLRQFRLQLHPALRSATIHLAPAELGRISIQLSVKDARVRAAVRAESPETLKILEYHLPELEASLASQGLEVDEFDLDLGFSGQGAGSPDAGDRPGFEANAEVTPAVDVSIDQARLARALAARSGVDMYA